jgi:hypothetical protein
MAKTYDPISTQTLGSAAASVTFSSIPATYTDLVLVANVKGAGAGYPKVQINGSATGISRLTLNNSGAGAGSIQDGLNYITAGTTVDTSNFVFNSITQFQNYSNTTTYKTLITRINSASAGIEVVVNGWASTSAITSIIYEISSYNMATGSTFTLYGIKAA